MSTPGTSPPPSKVRRPDLDTLYCINEDGSRRTIHPADVRGRFQARKKWLWGLLIGIYLVVPWIKVGGNPLILIDIPNRHFYLFGHTYNAQDFWLAFFWLTGLGFTLFVISALWGRIWCGYACPQTVFLEAVFRRIERFIEGGAQARERLAQAPMSLSKLARRGSKHILFILVSLVLSHTFLSYFMGVERVFEAVTGPPSEHWTAFLFVMVFTGIIYFNYAWFREQLCIVICPYGRLQGALYDSDTVVVGYDKGRGEPRGKYHKEDRGHCIDCYRCVAVCPTGIDIRNGNQMECIGCANCVDACDEVMAKLGQPSGLVRYDSQRGFEEGKRVFWRPRVFVYGVLLLMGIGAFTFAASRRTEFEARLLRLTGTAYVLENGLVRNQFVLHLYNKLEDKRVFDIEARGPEGVEFVLALHQVELESLTDIEIVVMVVVPREKFSPDLKPELVVRTGELERVVPITLLGPTK